jgi:hypothetical protein
MNAVRLVRHNTVMSKAHDSISDDLRHWIEQQHVFFVATAPAGAEGHVNCSPKGLDSLRVLGPLEVAYVDLTGSGAETIAHLRENGRIVLMFCAFNGPPKIVRLHGQGSILEGGTPEFDRLRPAFPDLVGTRAIVHVRVTRVSDSCGYAVPLMDFRSDRQTLIRWAESKGPQGLQVYRERKNASSIDGLPALTGAPAAAQ